MLKKILASLIIGTVIVSSGVSAQASQIKPLGDLQIVRKSDTQREVLIAYKEAGKTIKTNVPGYEIINPDKDSFSTENKVALINGKAPAKTPITISLYGTTDMTRKNYNLNKLPKAEEYIEVSSETIHSGNLGFFQKQLNLVTGINRIKIDFGAEGVNPIEIIVYVYEKAPSLKEVISVIA